MPSIRAAFYLERLVYIMWKPVKGYEGIYEVSDDGLIRSIDRYVINNGTPVLIKGKVKNQRVKNNGYVVTDLWKDGKGKTVHVHRVVADAFIENPENKTTVNHIDGNKENNNVDNLEWATPSEQNYHIYQHHLKSKEGIDKAIKAMMLARKRVV